MHTEIFRKQWQMIQQISLRVKQNLFGISLSVIIQEVKMESQYGGGSEFMDRHQALTHQLTRCSPREEF